VSRYDIKAGELGSLAVAPSPVFEVEKGASVAFAYGAKVYWDTANAKVADATGTGIILLGLCVSTAGSLASDPLVRVRLMAS
jgi:predicted RecA/RadA family phage recombinase